MSRPPFALLCALLLVSLRQRAAEPALASSLEGVDWPRLVRLSGVHLLTPALAPALADPALYESPDKDKVADLAKAEARLAEALAHAEEDWLHASARLEALRAEDPAS